MESFLFPEKDLFVMRKNEGTSSLGLGRKLYSLLDLIHNRFCVSLVS